MKFRVQFLFLEDIHLILFLPKISCASTKLSTQLSETVEEPFSSDITRTHCYKSAILNNVARSSALGTTLRDVCGDLKNFQNLGLKFGQGYWHAKLAWTSMIWARMQNKQILSFSKYTYTL